MIRSQKKNYELMSYIIIFFYKEAIRPPILVVRAFYLRKQIAYEARLFIVPYFSIRSSGTSAYPADQPSWLKMHRV